MHHLRFVTRSSDRMRCVGKYTVEAPLGFGFEQSQEPFGGRSGQVPEIGRAVRQPHHQRTQHWMAGQKLPETFAGRPYCDFVEPIIDSGMRRLRRDKARRRYDALREGAILQISERRHSAGTNFGSW